MKRMKMKEPVNLRHDGEAIAEDLRVSKELEEVENRLKQWCGL